MTFFTRGEELSSECGNPTLFHPPVSGLPSSSPLLHAWGSRLLINSVDSFWQVGLTLLCHQNWPLWRQLGCALTAPRTIPN